MAKTASSLLLVMVLLLAGCSGMSNTEQRLMSGGAIGATSGAVIAGPPGAVVGCGIGVLGGYLYDRDKKSSGSP